MKKKYTVTSALPYANGPLHIGHLAGAYLPADIFVRYQKLKGNDVLFICGSDEHGAAITIKSKKENLHPQKIVDYYHNMNKNSFIKFGIDFSIFHRTSSKLHHKTSRDFFLDLYENNQFIKKSSEQFYDDKHKQFLADRYISGECPKCNESEAYGDQCEKCGSALNPEELINPKSTLSGEAPIKKKTSHWYLPMQNHEKWLKKWIELGVIDGKKHHNPKEWRSQVIGQCKSWIDSGLKERAMTRDLDWGVKIPIENEDAKVLYVWLDAPIGYISATKQWAIENNKNWEDYWKNEKSELVHFIGKDNIVFHCIIFPIILKSRNIGYNLPTNVPANEFLNLEGKKISTSKNWAIWLHKYSQEFKGQEDSLRYSLCANAPENKDTDFTWSEFQARNNNELLSILGNFINRVVVLTNKYWNGVIPSRGSLEKCDTDILEKIEKAPDIIGSLIEKYQFRQAINEMMNVARYGNKYLADNEPWKLMKTDEERTKTIMNISLQIAASLSILSHPFLPFSSEKLRKMLNIPKLKWEDSKKDILKSNDKINEPILLFKKIEDDIIESQIKSLRS
tara:strand:+ start:14663 stop:16357 length:1695 start_codon:yes stop_codon:yes gene_type:complete